MLAINSTNLENDQFGYACCTIVATAPPALIEPLLDIEKLVDQDRVKIPGHVTDMGIFYDIRSRDNLLEAIQFVASAHQPILSNWLVSTGRGVVFGNCWRLSSLGRISYSEGQFEERRRSTS